MSFVQKSRVLHEFCCAVILHNPGQQVSLQTILCCKHQQYVAKTGLTLVCLQPAATDVHPMTDPTSPAIRLADLPDGAFQFGSAMPPPKVKPIFQGHHHMSDVEVIIA